MWHKTWFGPFLFNILIIFHDFTNNGQQESLELHEPLPCRFHTGNWIISLCLSFLGFEAHKIVCDLLGCCTSFWWTWPLSGRRFKQETITGFFVEGLELGVGQLPGPLKCLLLLLYLLLTLAFMQCVSVTRLIVVVVSLLLLSPWNVSWLSSQSWAASHGLLLGRLILLRCNLS